MAEKIIRDPVHDVIAFRLDRPTDRLLFSLLNAEEFQRLRRIRQLGMAHLAYPGADHSRSSHSLGVMQTARRILDRLSLDHKLDEGKLTACLCAALLHDLGHGPFSHVFERVSGVHHEKITYRVITDHDSSVHRILAEFDKSLPHRVVMLLKCEPIRDFWCDLLSSQLDADRLDYLLRDNLMTGSRYGDYDLAWLIQAMTIDPATNRLSVSHKGVSAVEAYLQARYHMYRNVYFHKVVRSAEGMVKLALQRARRMAVQDRLPWPPKDHVAYKTLMGQSLSMAEFVELDDISVWGCFKAWCKSDDASLAMLCKGLLFRGLYKTIDLSHVTDAQPLQAAVLAAEEAVTKAGGDPLYDVFFDQPADTPYKTATPPPNAETAAPEAGQQILVRDPSGRLADFGALSPMSQALANRLQFSRIHVAGEYRDAVAMAVKAALS
jgi:HD superfamily phosphohydrolase